jgi:hypothetical protein
MMWEQQRWQKFLLLSLLAGILLVPAPALSQQVPMGYFEVTSSPQGADVLVDGLFAGETPVIVPVRSLNPNGSTIKIMTQGFLTWEQQYTQNPLNGEIIPVHAALVPISPVGSLKVSSQPSGALVTINNGNGQMTPWTYQGLPTGTHLVSLFLMGFDPFIRTVEIQPGQTTDLVANMSPRTGSGRLQISSEPGGARTYVDGVYAGITNLVVGHITPGLHEVRVVRTGFEDFVEWVSVQNDSTSKVQASFKPVSETSGGFVVVTSDPPGASVFLDGVFSGMTETGRPLEITNVTPGSHQIYVSSKNYEDYEAVVVVASGSITPVSVSMNPSPMPQACAMLILTSDPSGADITIDGILQGKTPATIETVCSGTHTYALSLPGYQEYRAPVNLIPGQVFQVHTAMTTVTEPAGTSRQETPLSILVLLCGIIMSVAFFARKR